MSAVPQSMSERADALEMKMMDAMDKRIVARSNLYCLANGEDSMGPPINYGPGAHLDRKSTRLNSSH